MSEANLWKRIRDNVGHAGHFSRIEYNPTDGYPDTSYCIKGVEGHAELKYVERAPVKVDTRCFGDHGLRDSQKGWIHQRVKHGGRVFIVAGVGPLIIVVPGTEWRAFNDMTYFQLGKAGVTIAPGDWRAFLAALSAPMPPYARRSTGADHPPAGG